MRTVVTVTRRLVLAAAILAGSSPIVRASEPIEASVALPPSTPWDVRALSAAPDFEWLDSDSPVRSLLFEGPPYKGFEKTRVFAYYATPGTLSGEASKDSNLPAVVLVHGGGGTAFKVWVEQWARRGYAAIAMDLAGSRPIDGRSPADLQGRIRLPDGGPDQHLVDKFDTIDRPLTEQWPYHAVANTILAHSLVRSFPEVDASRTAVTGISWGGYVTCMVAALDHRFRAAVPVYGCGYLHENAGARHIFERLGQVRTQRWVELYDPSRYLPACRVPIFFINGTHDRAFPLDIYMKSVRAVPASTPRNIRIGVNMRHSHPAGWEPQEIGMFIDHHLLGTAALPTVRFQPVAAPADGSGTVSVKVWWDADDSLELHSDAPVQLRYTVDGGAIHERHWQAAAIEVEDFPHRTGLARVPADATAWFFTVAFQPGAFVSSEVVIRQ